MSLVPRRRYGCSWDLSDGLCGAVSSGAQFLVVIHGNIKSMLGAGMLIRVQTERWDGLYRAHVWRLPRNVREVKGIR